MVSLCSGCWHYYLDQCEEKISLDEKRETLICQHFRFMPTNHYKTQKGFLKHLQEVRAV